MPVSFAQPVVKKANVVGLRFNAFSKPRHKSDTH